MLVVRWILGGMVAAAVGLSASAETPAPAAREEAPVADRPVSRIETLEERLAGHRPHERPGGEDVALQAPLRPRARDPYLPNTRWEEERGAGAALWTRTMLSALSDHGGQLDDVVPRDIETWCPAYAQNPPERRRAFWVGVMSAVAWYESRFIPDVVGGGDLYYGLTQILPSTARAVGCRARTGAALLSGPANLSCAVRIMSVVVPDHRAVARAGGRNRGIASQWGPMVHGWARDEMAAWTRQQEYCQVQPIRVDSAPRPPARPETPPLVTRNSPYVD